MYGTCSIIDRAKFPCHWNSQRYDPRRTFVTVPAVQRFPEGEFNFDQNKNLKIRIRQFLTLDCFSLNLLINVYNEDIFKFHDHIVNVYS